LRPISHRSATLPLSVLLALATACGGDDGATDGAGSPDGSPGADASACPAPQDLLPPGWTPVTSVSGGAVASEAEGAGVTITKVDASAGGFMNSASEPFVYLDFSSGQAVKVSIDDAAAFSSDAWDLALKRYVIRANGGDSGPGGVEVAEVSGETIESVTVEPEASRFGTDRWTSASCTYLSDEIGGPLTRFSRWFSVDAGILSPEPFVYVVRLRGGDLIKLEIESYYADDADPDKSAVYDLRWSPL
jgi:hypothetical protein